MVSAEASGKLPWIYGVYKYFVQKIDFITSNIFRYFDLRVSTRKVDESLFYVHGLYGDEVSDSLNVINKFLENCSEEVVILDFQHFYNFTEENHGVLTDEIKAVFGDKLCPLPWEITTVTLSWMIDRGYRVIVVYRHQSVEKEDRYVTKSI